MTTDIEHTEPGGDLEPTRSAALEEQIAVERSVFRGVILRAALGVPVGVVIVLGLVALAIGGKDPDWGVWLGTLAAVGALAGAFFGALFAFIMKAHVLDELADHARGAKHG